MYRFYVSKEQITDDKVYIDGTDVNHIKNVLRLEKGDWIIACDKEGMDYVSRISDISSERVVLNIEKVQDSDTELPCKIVLFQGLPKKDKMEFIIQKAVELGVSKIVPVAMKRCVVRLDDKNGRQKGKTLADDSRSSRKTEWQGDYSGSDKSCKYQRGI